MAKYRLLPAASAAAGMLVSSLAWAQVQPPAVVSTPAIGTWGIALLGLLVVAIGLSSILAKGRTLAP